MSVHDDLVGQVGTCGNPGCDLCPPAEEDLSDAAQARTEDINARSGEAFVASELGPVAPPPKDDRIEDEAGLMRAFASLRRAARALAQNQRMQAPVLEEARKELQALEEKCAKANAALEARAEHHRNRIEVYARTHRDELVQGKRKTRDFGIGSVSFRTTGGEYRWRQDMSKADREAALLKWALAEEPYNRAKRTLTELVRSVDLATVKEHLAKRDDATLGSVDAPPGLEYVPEHDELSVKVEGDK